MATQEGAAVTTDHWPIVMCPGCRVQMAIKQVISDAPGKDTGTIVYVCDTCKTETTRPYKGPQMESQAS